jgi:hypothetical protein
VGDVLAGGDVNSAEYPKLALRPVTLTEARAFVAEHHRHNGPPASWKFGVGVECDGQLVGIAMASPPISRMLAVDPYLLEVNRTCTTGARNANSMLYGAIARAAKALGYRKLITYTYDSESGSSLLAAGWERDQPANHDTAGWVRNHGYQETLFGPARVASGPKHRWVKVL